jgi:2-dehydro-3-deoxygalactonokinase
MVKQFLSCDWGTSSFRLRIINSAEGSILAETADGKGIAAVHHEWLQSGRAANERISFYKSILSSQIIKLETAPLAGMPMIISGMASSSIGMIELPYTNIPFSIRDPNLHVHRIPVDDKFPHEIFIVSGLRTFGDVMRGEETMLPGCEINDGNHLLIFPGTHSKHAIVQNHIVKDFKTFMTGELFDLLSTKSILAGSVEKENLSASNLHHFIKGVHEAVSSNLLHDIFHVRTNQLFGKLGKKENYLYLSGLLIGGELKDLKKENSDSVIVVSSGSLLSLYAEALSALGLQDKLLLQNADGALIKGQAVILNQIIKITF